jgi:hypothetical protein
MGEVIPLFPNRRQPCTVIPDYLKELDARLKLIQMIRRKEEAVQVYQGVIANPKVPGDVFIARALLRPVQQELDILVAQYTGRYGPLDN